mmetsp:Transcript_6471/g.19635  ORF Transcript_6471/g.19635 Transcript_6471/m.19635 type:complete len:240 (-) Transcript_6471:123-842(-)|eukprot:CAMPEP_0174244716 /NCGR_PEP_ID=MMETSP0417-20130205/36304_1 /TAXON_ID=242541 /ORGANISM="Mayorella sp, Strain BSH-02190019" /LENGTH=239 /DNA_ID=CAMNT_0015324431 /DNA_START=79 /DNA_END=798 /DNA_ORIENTATION=+
MSDVEVLDFEPVPTPKYPLPSVPSALALSLSESLRSSFQGPTTHSNWIIPNRLLASAYPGYAGVEPMHSTQLRALLQAGARQFVNLLPPEQQKKCHPYWKDLPLLREQVEIPATDTLHMLRFPIEDYEIADDCEVAALALYVADLIRNTNNVVVIHCVGGHGRTGTVVPLVLTCLYPAMTAEHALELVGSAHQCRNNPSVCTHTSPENELQRDQVIRVSAQSARLAAKSSFSFKNLFLR